MSTNKDRKIKRLRKAHVWPSILFLLISFIFSTFAFVLLLSATMVMLVQDRIISVCTDATGVSKLIAAADGREKEVVENIKKDRTFSDSVFVFDKNGGLIADYGEETYNTHDTFKFDQMFLDDGFFDIFISKRKLSELDWRFTCYFDNDPDNNLLDTDGTVRLERLLDPSRYKSWADTKPDADTVIIEVRFWMGYDMPDGRMSMIKCSVPLYFGDFSRSLIMGVIALMIMSLPIFFFFINIVINVFHQRHITKLLYTDFSTGGKNWLYFEHQTEKAIGKVFSVGKLYAFTDITIMKYRSFCNCHGAQAGDKLLEDVNAWLSRYLNKGEYGAHTGKSTYALFLKCGDSESCVRRINTILGELSQQFGALGVTFHAGVYFHTPSKTEYAGAGDCFNRASAARATLTDENQTTLAIYNDKLLEEQLWEHKVELKMQAALDNEEFKVYVQPKYDPVTEKLAGAEALVRWINAEDGFISPGRFIPIFEKNGFITKLDDYMLSHVAKLQAGWLAEGKNVVPVSVNVSRAHFANPDLAQHICSLVDQYNVPHKYIEIELTESAFFDDKAALLRTVHQLRELGFEISMDDFGAGYSSLNSLKDLPLDVLKLDADFFRGENAEERGEIVVSQAIRLAKSLNMRIVAEGVEKKEQVDFLAGQGCDMIQGFYFAKPMPAEEYEQRLESPTKSEAEQPAETPDTDASSDNT